MRKSKAAIDMGVNGPPCGTIKGVKFHHDPDYSKNKDADVIPKGSARAIPNEYWQMDVSASVFPRGDGDLASTAFLPTPGKDRAQPHKKINDMDH
jgi:hypothetical protein